MEAAAAITELEDLITQTHLQSNGNVATQSVNGNKLNCDENKDDTESNDSNDMLYTINDVPPISTSIFLGLQHYLLAVGGIIGLPIILSSSLCMFETVEGLIGRASIISSLLFVSGICTFMQTTFGVRLPIMQGASYTFVTPALAMLHLPENKCPSHVAFNGNATTLYNDTDGMLVDGTELWQRRVRLIQGAILVSSVLEVVIGLTGVVGFVIRYVNPVTISCSIVLIGTALVPVAFEKASANWGIAFLTCAINIICSQYIANWHIPAPVIKCSSANGRKKAVSFTKIQPFKLFPVMISIVIAWLLSVILTCSGVYTNNQSQRGYWARTDARIKVLHHSQWFRIPYPLQWGMPRVLLGGVIGMSAAVIGGIIESVGDYYACAKLCEAPRPPPSAVNRGIVIEGLGCILNGLIGTSAATTSFSENSGAIAITRVGSRRVLQSASIILIFLGTFGKFGAFLVTIPDPIIGGMFIMVFSMIVSVGVGYLQHVNLKNTRNIFIIGMSLFMGMMLPRYLKQHPEVINTGSEDLDHVLLTLLEIPMLVGACVAMFFDVTLKGRDKNSDFAFISGEYKRSTCYDLPFQTNFKYAKYFPFLPEYNQKMQTKKRENGTEECFNEF